MTGYIKNFVTGHGIKFETNKRNLEAFEKASRKWAEIINSRLDIKDDSVILFCGAKNNGKSSLVRYVVNQYIYGTNKDLKHSDSDIEDIDREDNEDRNNESNNDKFAYYIDYDPGQPEMTTPGIVSAHIIKPLARRLQSPTYCNIQQHEPIGMCSVGGTNMSVNPKMYIENCRHIFNLVKEHQRAQIRRQPIFINTMGHIRNVGLAMLMDLIKTCRPTNLIVLNVDGDPMRTIYADLNSQAIDNTRASFYYETSQQLKKLNYICDVHNLDFSFVESSSISTKNRTALQLAYFGSIPDALYKPIMLLSPKWLQMESISIYCASSYPLKVGIVLELLYHSWVQLVKLKINICQNSTHNNDENDIHTGENANNFCNIIDDVGENQLFGCGIVADIDLEKKRLAIITPLDQATLIEKVDCLIKPLSIQVPREILQNA